ncbi:MAG: glycosyltransferase [Pseudomonadota bacterium]
MFNNQKVSIILTVLNEGAALRELLDALLAQSHPADEIVLVDGGSRDGTQGILEDYARKSSRVRFFVEPGVNISLGRNIAITRSTGDIIAVTDGGCQPDKDWLKELLQPFAADPAIGAVSGRFVPVYLNTFEYFCGNLSIPDQTDPSHAGKFYGRSSAFLRELWQRAGGYPEWLYTGEDTLFAIKAGRLGYKVVYAPRSLIEWRPRPTLRKMAKMFYLYGKGNGRIQNGDLKTALYWLRNHALLLLSLLAGFITPWFWLVSAYMLYLFIGTLILPDLNKPELRNSSPLARLFYTPIIVMTRNLSIHLGYVRGHREYLTNPEFKERLDAYLKP